MNSEHAANLTGSIIGLQRTIEKFQKDIDNGRIDFVVAPIEDDSLKNAFPYIQHLVSPNPDHATQLKDLSTRLKALETQLHLRSQWFPPTPTSTTITPLPSILDIADLTTAINLLSHIVASTDPSQTLSPRASFTKYTWSWDSEWKEFYTHIEASDIYIYLSRWKYNPQRNMWEHVNMALSNTTPEDAAEKLGAWQDWRWDEEWGEWCLDVRDDDGSPVVEGERCGVFPSRWQVDGPGEWIYVGGVGQAW
ncbi:hypothetical protein T440DRAFT_431352 [Plenodomus tracheiphilus IPT5]|uniref:Uncharacterized protein n=1 Tax=Plenodomus tracheiphilus IPT5 TaxID=1408161 RepID=A0A6A7AV96_9PLEO|nr:hypothetical protein T440DRAFT_431352 [Plenodomus tracheiphilus IPT5]